MGLEAVLVSVLENLLGMAQRAQCSHGTPSLLRQTDDAQEIQWDAGRSLFCVQADTAKWAVFHRTAMFSVLQLQETLFYRLDPTLPWPLEDTKHP